MQLFILIGLFASALSHPLVSATEAKTCVVSYLGDAALNSRLEMDALKLLHNMGYATSIRSSFQFYTNPKNTRESYQALKSCLEGSYEEVIVVAHTHQQVPGRPSILIPESVLKDGHGIRFAYLNDQFFVNIRLGPQLKMVTLVICQAERVLMQYTRLANMFDSASGSRIKLKLAPISEFESQIYSKLSSQDLSGLTAFRHASRIIAEAGQEPAQVRGQIFCYLHPSHPHDKRYAYCHRGNLQFTLPSDIRWSGSWWFFVQGSAMTSSFQSSWYASATNPGSGTQRAMQRSGQGNVRLTPVSTDTYSSGPSGLRMHFGHDSNANSL